MIISVAPELRESEDGKQSYLIGVSIYSPFIVSNEAIGSEKDINDGYQRFVTEDVINLYYASFPQKLFSGFIHSYNLIEFSLKGLKSLINDSVKASSFKPVSDGVSGPVGIVVFTGKALSLGLLPTFSLIGLLSLNLAVLNILPIPALDGGRFAFILYEVVLRRKPNPTVEKWTNSIGFLFLMGLIILVTVNDISKLPIIDKLFR